LSALVDRVKVDLNVRTRIGDLLIKHGLIEEGLTIGYNHTVVTHNSAPELQQRKLWVMFIDRQFGPLFLNLLGFLNAHRDDRIGKDVQLSIVHNIFSVIRKFPRERPKGRGFPSVPDQIKPSELLAFSMVCLVGIFLFLQGYNDEYL
jgi:hypothetical protein